MGIVHRQPRLQSRPRCTHHRWTILFATSLVLVGGIGCGQPQADTPAESDTAIAPAAESTPTEAESPTAPPTALMPDLANPVFDSPSSQASSGLVPPTPAEARLSTLQTGRPDPFARILQPIARTALTTTTGHSTTASPSPAGTGLPAPVTVAPPPLGTLPPVPVAASPTLPPLAAGSSLPIPGALPTTSPPSSANTSVNTTTVPVATAPATPPAPALPLASRIEVRGVVQVGEEVMAIVLDPVAQSTQQVKVGDTIGGNVRVKRIDVGGDRDPLVILEQNGQEYPRSVGSSASLNLS